MRVISKFEPITVEQFLAIDFGSDGKFELVDGMIQMMTGGTVRHGRVAGNIFHFLKTKLRGTRCRPYGSDTGLKIGETNMRYPDVSVYCGDRPTPAMENAQSLENPNVLFEVLSPSTQRHDQHDKLEEYRAIISLDTIVFIDTTLELTRVIQRVGPNSWRDDLFGQPHDVELPSLNLTISHQEIFARD